jgi:predicted nucleotidyltransferase
MAKIPRDPKEIFPEIIADYKNLFGDDLVSIILYGSATGQEYRPGKSDINFMIVLSEEGIEHLDLAFSSVKKWLKKNVAVPLFLTESYVETSLDAFPIEYLNIQRNYTLVFGKDILKDLEFNPDFLRLQCEREIKGKLILLREKFLQTGGRGKALIEVIEKSLPAFIAIFKALVYLIKGEALPQEKTRIIRSIAEELDIDAGVFEKLLDIKEEKVKLSESEITNLFKDYLRQVRKLSKLVDALGG